MIVVALKYHHFGPLDHSTCNPYIYKIGTPAQRLKVNFCQSICFNVTLINLAYLEEKRVGGPGHMLALCLPLRRREPSILEEWVNKWCGYKGCNENWPNLWFTENMIRQKTFLSKIRFIEWLFYADSAHWDCLVSFTSCALVRHGTRR